MSDDQWFMAIGGHQVGPVSRDDVVTNLRNGTIDGNTLVFGPGLTNWTPLKDVPQLATYLAGASGAARPAAPPPIVPGRRAHESGNTTMKKIAKVAVGKSIAPECEAREAAPLLRRRQAGRGAFRRGQVEQRVVAVRGEPRAVVGHGRRRRNVRAIDARIAFALGA